jgi:hypothetical protein
MRRTSTIASEAREAPKNVSSVRVENELVGPVEKLFPRASFFFDPREQVRRREQVGTGVGIRVNIKRMGCSLLREQVAVPLPVPISPLSLRERGGEMGQFRGKEQL